MLKVTHYQPVEDPNGSVVGIVNFYIPEWGLHLNECRYIRKKNGGFFVGFPSKRKEIEGQQPTYFPYYNFDKDKLDRFQSASQKAINEWIQTKGGYRDGE